MKKNDRNNWTISVTARLATAFCCVIYAITPQLACRCGCFCSDSPNCRCARIIDVRQASACASNNSESCCKRRTSCEADDNVVASCCCGTKANCCENDSACREKNVSCRDNRTDRQEPDRSRRCASFKKLPMVASEPSNALLKFVVASENITCEVATNADVRLANSRFYWDRRTVPRSPPSIRLHLLLNVLLN